MKKKFFTILQYVFFLGLGIFLVWWSVNSFDDKDWNDIKQSLKNAHYWLLFPVIGILFLSHWLRALRWKILMEPLGFYPKNSNTFFAVMIGYLANLAVPRLGEILKCTLLARYEKVPVNKLVGTMVAERAIDVISLIIVFFIAIITQSDIIGAYTTQLINRGASGEGKNIRNVLIILSVAGIALIFGLWFILKKFSNITIIHNFKKLLKGIWQGLTSIRYIRHKQAFFLYSISIWLLYYAATYIGFFALDETKIYGFREGVSVLAFGSVGMMLTQGGIGAYQLMVQKTMALYGLNETIGWAFGWVLWIAQTAVILLFGLISFGLLPFFNKKKYAPARQDI